MKFYLDNKNYKNILNALKDLYNTKKDKKSIFLKNYNTTAFIFVLSLFINTPIIFILLKLGIDIKNLIPPIMALNILGSILIFNSNIIQKFLHYGRKKILSDAISETDLKYFNFIVDEEDYYITNSLNNKILNYNKGLSIEEKEIIKEIGFSTFSLESIKFKILKKIIEEKSIETIIENKKELLNFIAYEFNENYAETLTKTLISRLESKIEKLDMDKIENLVNKITKSEELKKKIITI